MVFVTSIDEDGYKLKQLGKKWTLSLPTFPATAYEDMEPVSILKLFFNWGFYSLLVPFKVVWGSQRNAFILVTHKIQLVLCALFHALILYAMVKLSHHAFLDLDLSNAKNGSWINKVAHLVNVMTAYIFHFLCIKSLWMNKSQIAAIVNDLSIRNPGRVLNYLWSHPNITRLIGLASFATISCLHFFWGRFNSTLPTSSQYVIRSLLEHIQSYLELPEGGVMAMLISILSNMLQTNGISFYSYNIWQLLVLVCNLSGLGLEFKEKLAMDGITLDKGLEIYRGLTGKVTVVNGFWSRTLWFLAACTLSYYMQFSDFLFGHVSDGSSYGLIVYLSLNSLVFVVAAYFHALVQGAFVEWLETCHVKGEISDVAGNGKNVKGQDEPSILSFVAATYDQVRLMRVKQSLETSPIAICCGNSAVTGAFLKSLLGVSVAYGIILSQTRTT